MTTYALEHAPYMGVYSNSSEYIERYFGGTMPKVGDDVEFVVTQSYCDPRVKDDYAAPTFAVPWSTAVNITVENQLTYRYPRCLINVEMRVKKRPRP